MSNFALLLKKRQRVAHTAWRGRAPLRVLLAEEAEMEGVPPMHLPAALALNLGFTMVQKYSMGTAI